MYPCRDTGETISPSTCSSPRGSRDWNSETNPLPRTTAVGSTSAARPVRRLRPPREKTAGSKLPCSMARTSAPSVRCTSMPWRPLASCPAASAQVSGGTRAAVPSACSTVPGRDVAGVWRGASSAPRSHPARPPQQAARAHVSVRPRLMRRHRTESAVERPSAQRAFFVTLPTGSATRVPIVSGDAAPIASTASRSCPPQSSTVSARATMRRFGHAWGAAPRRARAEANASPVVRKWAMSATALDRLTPARQCTMSGSRARQPSRKSTTAAMWLRSGRMAPEAGSEMSSTGTRRWCAGVTASGVGG